MKENTTNLYVSSAQIFQSRFIDKSNRWWFVSAKGLTSKYVQSLVSIASSSCNSNAVVKCTRTWMLCICWHVHSFLSTIKRRGKKTFRCQIWTKVIWIVSGYLVFFFLSNFFFIFVCFVWMWCWVYVKSALTHWRSDWSQQRKTICFWKTLREYRSLRYWAAKSMNCLRCVDILHMFACCFHPVPFAVVSYFATKMLRMFT